MTILLAVSCGDDKITPPEPKPTVDFKNLQNKDDVLFNLELAYNERNMSEYDKLLDENFTFMYRGEDGTMVQWDRDREVRINSQILNPNLPGDLRVISIHLNLHYDAVYWIEQPENQDHPGESWYVKTVRYDLIVKTADDWEHRALGKHAEFTIRWAQTPGGEHWRIVLWRDDVDGD
jgi:hypothetical protein